MFHHSSHQFVPVLCGAVVGDNIILYDPTKGGYRCLADPVAGCIAAQPLMNRGKELYA
jgi:hypothetical protein